MNLGILVPMPTEAQLREWERGITQTIASWPVGPIRDPAFMEREPNPVMVIHLEDGRVIWAERDACAECARPAVVPFAPSLRR